MMEVRLLSRGRNYAHSFAAILAFNFAAGGDTATAGTPPPPDKPQSQIPEKVSPPLENGAKENKLQRENWRHKAAGQYRPRDDRETA
jgi:hypothetical protein